jgi:hypothetical protein
MPCAQRQSVRLLLPATILLSIAAWGQSGGDPGGLLPNPGGAIFGGETKAGADIGIQGYYIGGTQSLSTTSGAYIHFHDFVPGVGLLSVSLESYGADGRFRFGDNFVSLSGKVWRGRRWNFTIGDFQLSANPIETPFTNLLNPEISARGVKVDMSTKHRLVSAFFGEVTLLEGPRVPFRIGSGQYVMGANMRQKIGSRLTIGTRLLRVSASDSALSENGGLLTANRQFSSANNAAVQSLFQWTKHVQLFAEAGLAGGSLSPLSSASPTSTASPSYGVTTAIAPTQTGSAPLTALAGAVYDVPKITLRLNYVSQGASYLPVAGQFVGDRRGPFAELRYRPFKAVELYGSASRYRNNLEGSEDITTYHSSGFSTGSSLQLPWKFNLAGQLSELSYYALTPDPTAADSTLLREDSRNRQVSASLARTFGRQSIHVTWRNLKLEDNGVIQHQRSEEIEDQVGFGRFSFGVAARLQNATAEDRRNTVFVRGSLQANLHRFQAYAQVEIGQDLVNQTVFSTSAFSTTVVGVSAPMRHGWVVRAEMFRNRQNLLLNPQSIFLLGDSSTSLPTTLPGFDQWSLFLRVTKSFNWGGRLPAGSNMDDYMRQQLPITGSVEGFVSEVSLSGSHRVEGIPVVLDRDRVVKTDNEGHYVIPGVAEGAHRVALAIQELPAEFNPGQISAGGVVVTPQKVSRMDLQVIRLVEIHGHVDAPPKDGQDNDVETILIRLEPGGRYTTPDFDGNFAFYNLPEGQYQIKLDRKSLPPNGVMTTPEEVPVFLKMGERAPEIQFGYVIRVPEKPVHRTLVETITIDQSGAAAPVKSPAPTPAPATPATPSQTAPAAPVAPTPSGPTGSAGRALEPPAGRKLE